MRIVTELFQRYQNVPAAKASTEQFIRALAFNWVSYGPDAHAKNYSLLLAGPNVYLAPLYDISSAASYPDRYDPRTMMMAMSINKKFQNNLVTGDDWVALAKAIGVDADDVLGWVNDVVSHVAEAFSDVIHEQDSWIRELDMTAALLEGVTVAAGQLGRYLTPTFPRSNKSH